MRPDGCPAPIHPDMPLHPPIPSPITYISVIVLNHCGIKNEAIASDGPILILLFFSVHGEIIIGHLIKDIDNRMLRPNWLNDNEPYQIVTVKTALDNSESAMTAVAFEKTSDQLLRSVFDARNEINRVGVRSFSDFMFGEGYL